VIVRGEIVDYTGEVLKIRLKADSAVKVFPASEVLEVETPQTEWQRRGLQLLAQHDAVHARDELLFALDKEERSWVRRQILAALVRCALHEGDYVQAGTRFLALQKSDPKTRDFKLIPLVWAPQEVTGALREEAQTWLQSSSETAKLMGASFLFEDPKFHVLALATLKDLSTSTDRRLQMLAQAQVWRSRLSSTEISRIELQRWQIRIEWMEPGLRGGPYYLLGRGYLARREYEKGAMALLWIPLVHDDDPLLAARACLRAADALALIGERAAANNLYYEVAQRYAWTPFAQEARGNLQRPAETAAETEKEATARSPE
jgi:hypothetical protein